ncbi:serine/threonine protein kinase [Planktothricoides raciborskii]|uniref:non-specific serine/threonine protein kinase n=1 Tax=Planktothricoides raciborskii FACHB-1370 TaxID=2949576 RepID=A0ABR8EAP4_9CYAN|nr:serine/threonine-protein kinase [Planktothricoides raciborskii]MBD2542790.1 protein kinase [Planktothricoides raciborskii FACHB-1370]MBD2581463.1 protein kinase [Planktothricoides raciborskii FACHB-1261]
MSNFPDFSQQGYQIISQLGENHLGGRVTYLAERQNSPTQPDKVVIKQFQFALMGATWAEYDAYSQEIAMLRQLNHPGIAKYLDSFQTPDGFCMVQEYLNAESLATPRSWTPKQIKLLAESVLEILVYLQFQNPPIIHRDIKPENILVDGKDEQMHVYLVDFGFARMGGGEIAASSVVKGTMGFMPPEQLFNRQLTTASDLYGLGGTLICLLTGTKSVDIGNLIDADYRINFRHLVPPVKRGLIHWLEKLTDPRLPHRYPSAASALAELKTIDVDRLPKVRFSHQNLEITATEFGQILTETITITNPIPETTLSGRFSVAPHPSDPPHTPYDHAWISFHPQQFSGNEVECQITIDTSKLVANETYTRELVLHSNSASDYDSFTVQLNTAAVPTDNKIPYGLLLIIFVSACFGGFYLGKANLLLIFIPGLIPLVAAFDTIIRGRSQGFKVDFTISFLCAFFGQILALSIMIPMIYDNKLALVWLTLLMMSSWLGSLFGINGNFKKLSNFLMVILFIMAIFIFLIGVPLGLDILSALLALLGIPLFLAVLVIIGMGISLIFSFFITGFNQEYNQINYLIIFLFTAGLGISLGAGFLTYLTILEELFDLTNERILWLVNLGFIPVLLTSFGLGYSLSQQTKENRKIAKYRHFESTLIKP